MKEESTSTPPGDSDPSTTEVPVDKNRTLNDRMSLDETTAELASPSGVSQPVSVVSSEKSGADVASGSDADLRGAQGVEPEVVTSAPAESTNAPAEAVSVEVVSLDSTAVAAEGLDEPGVAQSEVAEALVQALKTEERSATLRPRSSPPPPPSRRRSDQSFPAVVPLSTDSVADDEAALSEIPVSVSPVSVVGLGSIPPVELRRVLPARSVRPRSDGSSGTPPALVEPSRIIEVLGSSTPALSDQWTDEVEDLDDSEAHELSDDTPLPDSITTEVDVEVVEETGEVLAEMDSGSATDAGAGPPPKKKRQRPPTPPSTRQEASVQVESNARKPWWEEMFSQEFLRAIPILLPGQLGREVDFIEGQLKISQGGRILDLACGAGQHAVELASRGYEVVGFDSSQAQLDWAGELALERMQKLQFINGDMRMLTYQEAFDGICCWNTSFGYFEEEKNLEVIQRMFAALRPGGRLLLDVVNRDYVVAEQPGQTWFEGDGCVCIDDVTIDFITSRMRVKRTMMLTSGKNLECGYSLRLYGLHELGKMLHTVGFKVMKVSGRPETPGVFFGDASPRLMILASKPAE